jgi:hypothetical protein
LAGEELEEEDILGEPLVSPTERSVSNSLSYEKELDLVPCNPAKLAYGVYVGFG